MTATVKRVEALGERVPDYVECPHCHTRVKVKDTILFVSGNGTVQLRTKCPNYTCINGRRGPGKIRVTINFSEVAEEEGQEN